MGLAADGQRGVIRKEVGVLPRGWVGGESGGRDLYLRGTERRALRLLLCSSSELGERRNMGRAQVVWESATALFFVETLYKKQL